MSSLDNLKRQHVEILKLVKDTQNIIKNNNIENDAAEIAVYINNLSGKLKIHLGTEDKFLYPNMLKSEDEKIRMSAETYIYEMGNLFEVFMGFKDEFNTRNKILGCKDEFYKISKVIFDAVEKRILKEDKELYPLLK